MKQFSNFLFVQQRTWILSGVLIVSMFNLSWGQSAFWNLDPFSNHILERLETKSGKLSPHLHLETKPIARNHLYLFLDSLDMASLNRVDSLNSLYLKRDGTEYSYQDESNGYSKGLLKHFFRNSADMYAIKNEEYNIHVSPVINFKAAANSPYGSLNSKNYLTNTRGLELRGSLGNKLGFYTFLSENITGSPNFLVNYYLNSEGYPYQGLVKIKNDSIRKLNVDYFAATGYIRFSPIKNLGLSFGHDRHFIGHGYRSLVLSDFSVPFLNFKTDLKIGKVQFLNILGQLTDTQVGRSSASEYTFPPKYLVFHRLGFNMFKKLNFGVFEQIMFGKRDAGFELNYLNPIIFYRFVESNVGSSDNAVIGIDFKYLLAKNYSIYGQYVLDEYNRKEFKKKGSWLEKYAYQIGLKAYDLIKIKNLDVQIEYNSVRPYTYTHFNSSTNFVNYNTPIAHPLGANFQEVLTILRYQPKQKIWLQVTHMYAQKGEDEDGFNYGGNLLKSYRFNRFRDTENVIGQGFTNTINNTEVLASYRLYHNLFLDLSGQFRSDSYYKGGIERVLQFGIRWNHPYRSFMF
ncbi:MAG: capsule assembly Wzi family protein [Leadbetterella sp.]